MSEMKYAILLSLLLLSVCTGIETKEIPNFHTVMFEPGQLEMAQKEIRSLTTFLITIPDSGCVQIDGPRSGSGYFDPVTAARVANVEGKISGYAFRRHIDFTTIIPVEPFWNPSSQPAIQLQPCQ